VFTPTPPGPTNGQLVQISPASTIPAGFTANLNYYVVAATQTTFQLALTPGGASINSTSTGTGTVIQIINIPGYV
jgi:hypothetical protein